MNDDDQHREGKWQDHWQWALGMLSRGRRPAAATRVVVVDDVSGSDLRQTGSLIADRYQVAAFVGTHTYLRIVPTRFGMALHCLSSPARTSNTAALQLSNSPGAGEANVLEIDPEVNGNVSQFPWRTGGIGPFPGPEFAGWLAPRMRPYRIFRGTCGQRGPVILPMADAGAIALPGADDRHFKVHWFNPPLVFYSPIYLIGQLADTAIDVGFVVEIPMRGAQEAEG